MNFAALLISLERGSPASLRRRERRGHRCPGWGHLGLPSQPSFPSLPRQDILDPTGSEARGEGDEEDAVFPEMQGTTWILGKAGVLRGGK